MIAAFTGTREGCTAPQLAMLEAALLELGITVLHHGGCIGADDQCSRLCQRLGIRRVCHPANLPARYRAVEHSEEYLEPRSPLERNHHLVDAGEMLLACPQSATEELRSGTWSAVRYARRSGKPVWLILPDGGVRKEGGTL